MSPSLPYVTGAEVERRVTVTQAADALERALLAGVNPEDDPARVSVRIDGGELLVMPTGATGLGVVKLLSVGGDPRIQGVCVVFDARTLAPAALIDGVALTNIRTPAVSMIAVRRLATAEAHRLLVFGRGPQAEGHVRAISQARPIQKVDVVGRDHDPDATDRLIEQADIICCCTTARDPLFNGELVPDHALVVAIGSHEANARELDSGLVGRSSVVVESRGSALREAGDVIAALEDDTIKEGQLITLADLVRGQDAPLSTGKPRLFKSTGMSWEDAVVAAQVLEAGPVSAQR
jgi:ornithine cyclodeaminase/alanine dehydrogenase-like protein (mu-crystallin family)